MQLTRPLLAAAILSATVGLSACSSDGKRTVSDLDDRSISLVQTGRFTSADNQFDESAAEIVAFDPDSARTFVVNAQQGALDVLSLEDPANPVKVTTLVAGQQWADAGAINSVSVANGLVAIAVENRIRTSPGRVQVYSATDLAFLGQADVGALPDMVAFTPDGRHLLTANEGEPNADYSIDPEGSVSLINVDNPRQPVVTTLDFRAFNRDGQRAGELPEQVRIFGNYGRTELLITGHLDGEQARLMVADASAVKSGMWLTIASSEGDPLPYRVERVEGNTLVLSTGFDGDTEADNEDTQLRVFLHDGQSSVAQDLEPEYIAVSPDGSKAWVTLQENNAVAVIDLEQKRIERILALGTKDHGLPGNELDVSDKDEAINIASWPVLGMYMPDTIKSVTINGEVYYLTANEGDAREYDGFVEEIRFKGAPLADVAPFNHGDVDFSDKKHLGRLLTTLTADTNGDGELDVPLAYGARSFSIWSADGRLIADSGSDFETITADVLGEHFNNDNDENSGDSRSDAKGPEPEAIEVAHIEGRTYAFIGLERTGGIMVYDISNPASPRHVQYLNDRDFSYPIEERIDDGNQPAWAAGDLGPESILFVSEADAPGDSPLLIVGNEVSGTTTIYEIR